MGYLNPMIKSGLYPLFLALSVADPKWAEVYPEWTGGLETCLQHPGAVVVEQVWNLKNYPAW